MSNVGNKVDKANAVLGSVTEALAVATALNSTKVYKGKDKVDKALVGAAKAASVARTALSLFSMFKK